MNNEAVVPLLLLLLQPAANSYSTTTGYYYSALFLFSRGTTSKRPLADVGNVAIPRRARPQRKRNVKTKNVVVKENIPNFDSFENYELVVQPVTPMKTHVSISTLNSEEDFDKYSTHELMAELALHRLSSPVCSSPNPRVTRSQAKQQFSQAVAKYGDRAPSAVISNVSRVDQTSIVPCSVCLNCVPDIGRSNSAAVQQTSLIPCSVCLERLPTTSQSASSSSVTSTVQTRRAKRLRQLLSDHNTSLSTSTPEQHPNKLCRYTYIHVIIVRLFIKFVSLIVQKTALHGIYILD